MAAPLTGGSARRIASLLATAFALSLGIAAPASAAHPGAGDGALVFGSGPTRSPVDDLVESMGGNGDEPRAGLDSPDPEFEPKMLRGLGRAESRTVGGVYEMEIGDRVVQLDKHTAADEALANSSNFKLSPLQTAPPACTSSGRRFVAVYAYPQGSPNRLSEYTDAIRTTFWRMNGKLAQESALASGVSRLATMRVDCDSLGRVEVVSVPVPTTCAPTGDPGLATDGTCYPDYGGHVAWAVEKALGIPMGSKSVKYVIFYDRSGTGYSGVGFGWFSGNGDVKDRDQNPNRNYTSSAVLYPPYWDSVTALHEVGHLMGAVQDSAPHSTGASHCIDGNDVMCYRDRQVSSFTDTDPDFCPNGAHNALGFRYDSAEGMPFDCGYDDYFRPVGGNTYLDTHWNVGGYENDLLTYAPEWPAPPQAPLEPGEGTDLNLRQYRIGRKRKPGFSVQVRNDGNELSSAGATVVSSLSKRARIHSLRAPGWECSTDALIIGCTQRNPLDPDYGYAPIKIYLKRPGRGSRTIRNNAALFSDGDVNAANNTAEAATRVHGPKKKKKKKKKKKR